MENLVKRNWSPEQFELSERDSVLFPIPRLARRRAGQSGVSLRSARELYFNVVEFTFYCQTL